METRTFQRTEYVDVNETVKEIEKRFPVDPHYRDWKGRGEINVRCPKCTDKKYHLGLNFAKNAFNCYRCTFHGKLSDFLKFNGIRFRTKNEIHESVSSQGESFKIQSPKDREKDMSISEMAKRYLISRGFDFEFVRKNFKIRAITDKNQYYFGYIVIDINDYAFYARKFIDSGPCPHKHVIRKTDPNMKLFYEYNKNYSEVVIVCESMLNLVKAAQFGYDAVCIFGKSKWQSLVEYLNKRKDNREICLVFDKDVNLQHVEVFVSKVLKKQGRAKISYTESSKMMYNDIADMKTSEDLQNLVKQRKSTNDIFLSLIS
jgi:hypothetical protein